MASMIDQLRPASYRGLRFAIPDDDIGFGRRVITHEYPGRDDPFHEDMGAAARVMNVTALIGGAVFLQDAAAFEAALEEKGPGTLVHPHYGEITVIVKTVRRMHSDSSIGLVQFSIAFERYGKPKYPSATSDTAAGLGVASGDMFDAIRSDFTAFFSGAGVTDFVAADGLERVNGMVDSLRNVLAQRNAGGVFPDMGIITSLDGGLVDNVIGLFRDIASVTRGKPQAMIGPSAAPPVSSPKAVMKGLIASADLSKDTAAVNNSRNRLIIADNSAAITNLFQGAAAASLAEVARSADYESKQEAEELRSRATDALLATRHRYGEQGWDDSWRGMAGVISALTRDVNDRIGRLPQTVRIKPAGMRTSIDLAHRLYGDNLSAIFDRADDITQRNSVRHPGFVPAEELEVLINDK